MTWAALLESWKTSLVEREIDSFFIQSAENGRELTNTYQSLGGIERFTEFLERKARDEANLDEPGIVYLGIGGAF